MKTKKLAGSKWQVDGKEYTEYKVLKGDGDGLGMIAQRHGFKGYQGFLRLSNGSATAIGNANMINVGETLLLPVQEGTLTKHSPPYYLPLDPEYDRLYKAVEDPDANPNVVGPAVTALLNYCEQSIDRAITWLTSHDSQAEQTVQSKFKMAASTWKGCLADNNAAVDALMDPITISFHNVSGNDYARGMGLAKADLLHGRLVQLNRLIAMQKYFTAYESTLRK